MFRDSVDRSIYEYQEVFCRYLNRIDDKYVKYNVVEQEWIIFHTIYIYNVRNEQK